VERRIPVRRYRIAIPVGRELLMGGEISVGRKATIPVGRETPMGM